ncbi:hypothetical protein CMQ_4869 [Grosmannia clavigera kw1407]|uniref:Uncharacterized protein n=1 Tax=Grosmannia clavigera (strain kw1407 / UAMH 11150) TaxID=655863 RepID=F0XV06_GROCL|nr:uncharacterized protein CMQ_4869 [Grosmannia clavigera kw1407]EFW99017.1 hypothetical protein CMQ_4869 [Grosmannia clavigera kw1407]
MDDSVDIYLTSVWKYEDAGVERVLAELRKQTPQGQFEFEPEAGWFKATCPASKVADVQAHFRTIHTEIERDLQTQDGAKVIASLLQTLVVHALSLLTSIIYVQIPLDSKWLKVPSPGELPAQSNTEKKAIIDYQCPVRFDNYNYTQVWKRVKEETPDAITIHTFLSAQDMATISESSGVFIQCDSTDRLAYLGGPSKQSLSQASTMLDNMFRRYAHTMPPPKHLLHAETEGIHHVDVRYMAHVNEAMLTSTILDPGHFPGNKMNTMFEAIFSKAVCLRICIFDPFKRTEVSFFGPRVKPLFHDQAHKSPSWLKDEEYAPKALGVTAPSELPSTNEPDKSQTPPKDSEANGWEKQLDLLSLESKDLEKMAEATNGRPALKPASLAPPPENGKYGYQMRLLWEFVNNPVPGPKTDASKSSKLITTLDDDNRENTLIDIGTDETTPSVAKSVEDGSRQGDQPLIDLPVQALSVGKSSSGFSSTLSRKLCRQIKLLTADLPYCRGRVQMHAALGRIYMMDANPSGLATNGPGERASGWAPTDIVTRLDTVCVSPGSVMFTKALSIFANDIENVVGTGTSNPLWTFKEKRVIYEFKCQRFSFTSDGVPRAHNPFVVEIDGTRPGAFTYNMRRLEDARPPIWVHCIRRHWDVRIAVMYSPTEKLEKMYGDFAQGLLRSMVVPPGPIGPGTGPRFQVGYDYREMSATTGPRFCTKILNARVRHVGRHVSRDGESFLDVSWNRHMKLETKPDNSDSRMGILRATAAADDPVHGVFGSWYEASVLSVRAEEAFRENETLGVGGAAAWTSSAMQESMSRAMFEPALDLVEKMDGVGVLIDNGQGDTMWTPPANQMNMALVPASGRFW